MKRNNKGEIEGKTAGLDFTNKENVIIIDDASTRRRITLKNIKIPDNLGDYSRLIFTVGADGKIGVMGE